MRVGKLVLNGLQKKRRKHRAVASKATRKKNKITPLKGVIEFKSKSKIKPIKEKSLAIPEKTEAEPQVNGEFTTSELIRPSEILKNSLEGFLMDQRSSHTRNAYAKDLKRFVKYLLAREFEKGVETLNRTIVISYKESLLEQGLEHTSVDRHLATLRSLFRWLVEDGVLEKNPANNVRFMKPKRVSTTNAFTDDEVQKILQLPNLHTKIGAQHYAILMILFYCGLRRSELCSLRTTHLFKERGHQLLRLRGKGNSERVIVLVSAVWHAIEFLFMITGRAFSKDQYLFMPLKNNRTKDLKKSLDDSSVFYIVKKYANLAGISKKVSPHSCRATAISNARDHQISDRAIQEFAGWSSPDMITRYDKRKTAIEDSAAHAISYGGHEKNHKVSKYLKDPIQKSLIKSEQKIPRRPSKKTPEQCQ